MDWTWAPNDRVRSKVTPRNLGVGFNKRGMPRRFSRGWKWLDGDLYRKRRTHTSFDWVEVSISWTMFLGQWGRIGQQKMLWAGLRRRTRSSAYMEAWASRGKSLVMSSTNRMKRTGPSTEPWGTLGLMRKKRLQKPPTWTLAQRSERKERTQRTKQGGEFEQEEFMKHCRVPDQVESLGEVNRC